MPKAKKSAKKSVLKDLKPAKDAKGGGRHAETSKGGKSLNQVRQRNLN